MAKIVVHPLLMPITHTSDKTLYWIEHLQAARPLDIAGTRTFLGTPNTLGAEIG